MKKFIIKILKIILFITFLLLAFFLVFGAVRSMEWEWWVGLLILTGLLSLLLGFVFFKKIWLRRREQRFIHQVIEQDESYLNNLSDKERGSSKEIQERWKEAIGTLRKSHLKKRGNPLYVLPWYMIIGESGSGKTTAITSARLSSPFAEISRTSGISGTRNCDWWFFEQAILIDTAGRWAIPVDEGRDKEEWQKFLSLLSKYRKKEPLNGLVVTIAADKLTDSSPEALEETGKSIRSRIDEIMRVLGAKFPVYVLVTKCDLIQGMTQFCDGISEKTENVHDQALGILRNLPKGAIHDLSKDIDKFAGSTIHTIGERLKDFRLLLLHKHGSKTDEPGLLLFPEEFEKLKPGLEVFVRGAFQENPFQETPFLRGLFFSSGKQEGSPFSHFLKELGLIEEKEVLPGTNKGLFLHDIFTKILPSDRGLFAPTQSFIEWRRMIKYLGLASWFAIAVTACILLYTSYNKNHNTLTNVKQQLEPIAYQDKTSPDAFTKLNQFYETITEVEKQNHSWWVNWLWLNKSKDIEKKLKEEYCKQFLTNFLSHFDFEMEKNIKDFSAATSEQDIQKYITHLVKRVNLLQARINGGSLEWLQSQSQPSFDPVVLEANQNLIPNYHYYLIWQQDTDKTGLNQEMDNLQEMLEDILKNKDITLKWLVRWANEDPSLKPILMSDFWKGTKSKEDDVIVFPAFTVEGKKKIDVFVEEIKSALSGAHRLQSKQNRIVEEKTGDFNSWYVDSYFKAWHDFVRFFPNGLSRLEGREEWQKAAEGMASDQGPYFVLIETIARELGPLAKNRRVPPWINLVFDFQDAKFQAQIIEKGETLKDGSGLLGKPKKSIATIYNRAEKFVGFNTEQTQAMQLRLRTAGQAIADYRVALKELIPVSTSRKAAYDMAVELYNREDSEPGKSSFYTAEKAMLELNRTLINTQADLDTTWKLVTGPLDFFNELVLKESACYLQSQWEKEIIKEISEVTETKEQNNLLMGKGGLVDTFKNNTIAPFIDYDKDVGYFSKKDKMGRKIDFEKNFLFYLTESGKVTKIKENYNVLIKGYSAEVNDDALVYPHATILELQCAGKKSQELIITSFSEEQAFNWSPQTCKNVILTIEFKNKKLTKKYTGDMAFAEFVYDFYYNQFRSPLEFPSEEAGLKHDGITRIKVKYEFQKQEIEPILKLLKSGSGKTPEVIVKCWE
jgi:type VI secretion system protein ImpL